MSFKKDFTGQICRGDTTPIEVLGLDDLDVSPRVIIL